VITVEYHQNDGINLPDGKVEQFAKDFMNSAGSNTHIKVCSFLIIEAIRAEVAIGNVDHTKVQFKYGDKILKMNQHARISEWPKGFGDIHDDFLHAILDAGSKAAKAKRK
jgi:hypothetical protein